MPSAWVSANPTSQSIQRHGRLVHVVDIIVDRLNTITAGAKDAVPEASLLAVVVALLPALAVVQVVVFDDQLSIEVAEGPAESRGWGRMDSEATVTSELGKDDVLMADPPLIKAHRHTHELHREVGHERDTSDVKELLFQVGVERQQRVRMLGEMVGAVVFPQPADVMHQAVVPIEPEVEDDAVKSSLKRQPGETH